MRGAFAAACVLALALAGGAAASEQNPTLPELERELICPTCHEPLAVSTSPIADRMRAFIRARIAAGDTKSEIKAKLLAWVLPLVGLAVGAVVLAVLARRWSRSRAVPPLAGPMGNGRAPLDPELERRLDQELARFDA
jgi:cytochrome c-type biogenesis protein CcmH